MNTIGNNQGIQPTGPGVQVQDKMTQSKPAVDDAAAAGPDETKRQTQVEAGVQPPSLQPKTGPNYLDPEQMREFAAKVAEAIRKASVEPHVVGFRPEPDSRGYLIEIRRPDGSLITSFAPEKVLNLHGNPDDLAGMVIDRKS